MKKVLSFVTLSLCLFLFSCKKEQFSNYENMEVVENSFTGNVDITSTGQDPAGDFTGTNRSGTYSFAWVNPKKRASVNFDVTTSAGGTVQMILQDANGEEVLNQTRPGNGSDTFSGLSEEGRSGTWLVTIIFANLSGDGSFSLHPGE